MVLLVLVKNKKSISSSKKKEFFEFYCVIPTILGELWSWFCFEKGSLGIEIIEELVNQYQPSGNFEISWDANGYNSGLYFVKCSTGSEVLIQKILLCLQTLGLPGNHAIE